MNFKMISVGILTLILLASGVSAISFKPIKLTDLQEFTTIQKENLYRDRFEIREIPIRIESIERFIQIHNKDMENADKVVIISRVVKPISRELISNDLMRMNRLFIKKFADKLVNESTNDTLHQRIESYKQHLEEKKSIRLNINKFHIRELFLKKIDRKSFINQLWNS